MLQLQEPCMSVRFGSFKSSVKIETQKECFKLKSVDGVYTTETKNVLVVPKINLSRRKIFRPKIKHHWSHLASLNLPAIDSEKVKILIGMDLSTAHQTTQII